MVMAGHDPAIVFSDEAVPVFRKIMTWIVIVPLAAAIVAFAVANRQAVTVSFDPFSSASPAYAATLPLFALLFVVLIAGVLIGGIASWLRQGKWRRTARKLDSEFHALHQEIDALRRRAGPAQPERPPAEASHLAVLPPPGA